MLIRTHMEELREHTNDVLYERYRSDKLLTMGVTQDHTVFKEVNPAVKMAEERSLHEAKLSKMEAEMKMVFQQKVQEKEAKLKQSEEDVTSPAAGRSGGTSADGDPYRHLEDSFAPETKAFVDAQNALTTPYLESFPHVSTLHKTLGSHTSFASVAAYTLAADGRAYWQVSRPGLPQPIIRRALAAELDLDTFTGEGGQVFFDVNELEGEGTASQSWSSVSPGGKYWAGLISRGGSDWQTVLIIDTVTKERVGEELTDVKFCWSKFYVCVDEDT